jgi:hypothetical protein
VRSSPAWREPALRDQGAKGDGETEGGGRGELRLPGAGCAQRRSAEGPRDGGGVGKQAVRPADEGDGGGGGTGEDRELTRDADGPGDRRTALGQRGGEVESDRDAAPPRVDPERAPQQSAGHRVPAGDLLAGAERDPKRPTTTGRARRPAFWRARHKPSSAVADERGDDGSVTATEVAWSCPSSTTCAPSGRSCTGRTVSGAVARHRRQLRLLGPVGDVDALLPRPQHPHDHSCDVLGAVRYHPGRASTPGW